MQKADRAKKHEREHEHPREDGAADGDLGKGHFDYLMPRTGLGLGAGRLGGEDLSRAVKLRFGMGFAFQVGHEAVGAGDDEKGEEGRDDDAADDGDGHRNAALRAGAEREGRAGRRRPAWRGRVMRIGRRRTGPGGEDGIAHGVAVDEAAGVAEFHQKDGVFLHDAHEEHEADEAVEIDRLSGEEEREEGAADAEGKREQYRERMNEAVELRGEDHVRDDDAKPEREE